MSLKNERFLWRVYCTVGQNYEFVVSDVEPTVCPSDGNPINTNLTTIINSVFTDLYSEGYINIESALADNRAIRIINSDSNGGIDMNAGFGGIAIDSTNAISLDGRAGSNFSTISGNLDFEAVNTNTGPSGPTGPGGLLNMDADSGINIGCEATQNAQNTSIINIGVSNLDKDIQVGNLFGGTDLSLCGGTGGLKLQSTGQILVESTDTNSNSIRFDTTGGFDIDTNGDINMASGSSLGSAITLDTAFNNGGINISSGNQGIAINSNGGLLGIGHWNGGNIQLGTAGVARTITIGNQTTTTELVLNGGTNGIDIDTTGSFNVTSTSTASDAIRLNTGGGLDVDTTGNINFSTASSLGGAITLDAGFNNGGITISSGTQGIAINSNGGLIGLGIWNGGNIQIGTATVARTITLGNTTSTTSVSINTGTGGLALGCNANSGDILIGDTTNSKTVVVGNNTGTSALFNRFGTSGIIKTQLGDTSYSDGDQTATISHLLTGILRMTPSTTRTITLATASNVVSGVSGSEVNDSFDFSVINEDSTNNIDITSGTGGTEIGNMTILADSSGLFRVRITNITASSEAYTIYRLS